MHSSQTIVSLSRERDAIYTLKMGYNLGTAETHGILSRVQLWLKVNTFTMELVLAALNTENVESGRRQRMKQ